MPSVTGYEYPQHDCMGADCLCRKQWPNNPRPFYVMRYRDDSLEFDASTLANAQSYIASFDCDDRVYIWDTLTNKVL